MVDEKEVRHIAHLARLTLSDDQVAVFAGQLSAVIDHFRELQQVDTHGIDPTAHPLPVTNVFRDDAPTEPLGADALLVNAPGHQQNYFTLPKVLDDSGA